MSAVPSILMSITLFLWVSSFIVGMSWLRWFLSLIFASSAGTLLLMSALTVSGVLFTIIYFLWFSVHIGATVYIVYLGKSFSLFLLNYALMPEFWTASVGYFESGLILFCFTIALCLYRKRQTYVLKAWLFMLTILLLSGVLMFNGRKVSFWTDTHFLYTDCVSIITKWFPKTAISGESNPIKVNNFLMSIASFDMSGRSLVLREQKKPVNVLLIIVEGISGALLNKVALYHELPLTNNIHLPFFNKLMEQEYSLKSFFSTAPGTINGLWSVGFGKNSILRKINYDLDRMRDTETWIKHLNQNGYNSVAYFGASRTFGLLYPFFKTVGFQEVDGFQGIRNEAIGPINLISGWGADDLTFYNNAFLKISDDLQPSGKPWVMQLLTVSTHYPFNIPIEFQNKNEFSPINALKFADYAMQNFMTRLKESGIAKDTLILITSDESTSSMYAVDVVKMINNKPLVGNLSYLIVIPPEGDAIVSRSNENYFSLLDVGASVLDYLEIDGSGSVAGRSVFREYEEEKPFFMSAYCGEAHLTLVSGDKAYYVFSGWEKPLALLELDNTSKTLGPTSVLQIDLNYMNSVTDMDMRWNFNKIFEVLDNATGTKDIWSFINNSDLSKKRLSFNNQNQANGDETVIIVRSEPIVWSAFQNFHMYQIVRQIPYLYPAGAEVSDGQFIPSNVDDIIEWEYDIEALSDNKGVVSLLPFYLIRYQTLYGDQLPLPVNLQPGDRISFHSKYTPGINFLKKRNMKSNEEFYLIWMFGDNSGDGILVHKNKRIAYPNPEITKRGDGIMEIISLELRDKHGVIIPFTKTGKGYFETMLENSYAEDNAEKVRWTLPSQFQNDKLHIPVYVSLPQDFRGITFKGEYDIKTGDITKLLRGEAETVRLRYGAMETPEGTVVWRNRLLSMIVGVPESGLLEIDMDISNMNWLQRKLFSFVVRVDGKEVKHKVFNANDIIHISVPFSFSEARAIEVVIENMLPFEFFRDICCPVEYPLSIIKIGIKER